MSLTQKAASAGVSLAIAQVLRRLWGIAVQALLARLLLPEDFGVVAATATVVGLLSIFSDIGLNSALVQRLEVTRQQLTATFAANVALGVSLAIAGYMATPLISRLFHEPKLLMIFPVILLTIPLNSLSSVSDALLQRRMEFYKLAVIETSSGLGGGVAGVVLARQGYGTWALVAQMVLTSLILTVGKTMAAGWLPDRAIDLRAAAPLISFSAAVFGATILNHFVNQLDNVLIGHRLGSQALGYYSLAFNLVLMPSAYLAGILNRILFPALSSLQNEPERFVAGYLRAVRVSAFVALPAIFGLAAVASIAVPVVYGPQWAPSIVLVQILCVVGAGQAINTSGIVFYALGRSRFLFGWAIIAVAVVSIAFFAGVRWGLFGIACSYAIVAPILFITPHLLANRQLSIRNGRFVAVLSHPFIAAALMGIAEAIFVRGISPPPTVLTLAGLILLGAFCYAVTVGVLSFASGCRSVAMFSAWLTGSDSPGGSPASFRPASLRQEGR